MALVPARGNGAHVDENVLIRFAQKLACNEKKVRDRALNKLRKWIENRSQIATGTNGGFTEEDFMKIWKGLHYCLWMSDKPLVQEDVATNIASLILCFSHIDTSMAFIKAFFKTISREWNLIDRQRLDKFMTLVRRCVAASFELLKKRGWEETTVTRFLKVLFASVVTGGNDRVPDGLKFHVLDIFFEELKKVTKGTLGTGETQLFLDPFCVTLARTTNKRVFAHIMKEVFHRILRESKAENEGDDEDRCRLEFDLEAIHIRLFLLASGKTCVDRNRAKIYELVKRYRDVCTNSSQPPEENGISHLSVFDPETDSSSKDTRHKENNLKGRMDVDESEGSGRVKEKNGKKRHKGKEKPGDKCAKKRKHEKEESDALCNGQLDADPGLTKIKRKKNRSKDAAQDLTTCLFPKSSKKNCEIIEMNGQVNGEIASPKHKSKKPVQVNHTPDGAGNKGIGKRKSKEVKKGKASGKNVNKRDSKENDTSLTTHMSVNDKESDVTLSVNMRQSPAKQLKKKNSFASFSSPSNSPAQSAVFLKHAMKKASPTTDTKKKRKVSPASSLSASAKKRVIFAMGKNTSQEFIDSFTASPVTPFNPVQKPGQGILKSPASLGASPVSSLTNKLLRMRSTAADFF